MRLSLAIDADPKLPHVWANRATVRFRQGRAEAALHDLDQALALGEDPEILFNRGRVLEALERWSGAASDYRRALALGVSGAEAIQRRLDHCLTRGDGQPPKPAV